MFWIGFAVGFVTGVITIVSISCIVASGEVKNENKEILNNDNRRKNHTA